MTTTFESAIKRADSDLAHVQSALDTAQQVLDLADRAHSTGRRVVKSFRIVAIILVIGGVAVTAVMLFNRLTQQVSSRQLGDEASDATPTDQSESATSAAGQSSST
jgi:hypothetical protein